MEVVCPKCNAVYKIPDNKVPTQNAVLTCKRCDHRISVRPIIQSGKTLKVPLAAEVAPAQPAVSKPTATHPNEIRQCYPQVGAYNAEQYDMTEILIPTKKGEYKTRLNQSKLKLLDAAKSVLDRLLDTDERIARVAPATAYYPWELFLGNGWLTLLYNRYVIVATNKRLVAINTNARMNKATHFVFQFPYGSIKKITKGLFGTSLVLTRKQAKRRVFNGIKRPLAGAMHQWIAARIDPRRPIDSPPDQCDNLCPACCAPLAAKLGACPVCGVVFKSPQKAALRSLLLPGLGDFYLGHRFLGVVELIGALVVWSVALGLFISGLPENIVFGVLLLLFVNGMDALLTLYMGKKGYALEKHNAMGKAHGSVQAGIA